MSWLARRRQRNTERLLDAFERDPGPRYIYGDLQDETKIRYAALHKLLNQLINEGWVSRDLVVPRPGRSGRAAYTLTEAGIRWVELRRAS